MFGIGLTILIYNFIKRRKSSKIVKEINEAGNAKCEQRDFTEAVRLYSKAINLCPNEGMYFVNRSAAYLELKDFSAALNDAKMGLTLNPLLCKGHELAAKCCLALGDICGTKQAINDFLSLQPSNITKGKQLHYIQIHKHFSSIYLEVSKWQEKLVNAERMIKLDAFDRAEIILADVGQTESQAIFLWGLLFYYTDRLDSAITHFKRALELDIFHVRAKKMLEKTNHLKDLMKTANRLMEEGKLPDALKSFTKALVIDIANNRVKSQLYSGRALVYKKLEKLVDAISDCTKSLESHNDNHKARTLIHNTLKRYRKMGDMSVASGVIENVSRIGQGNPVLSDEIQQLKQLQNLQDLAATCCETNDWSTCLVQVDSILAMAPFSKRYQILKAECLTMLSRFAEASEIVSKVVLVEQRNVDAIYVRGLILYHRDQIDAAMANLRAVLVINKDHKKTNQLQVKILTIKRLEVTANQLFNENLFVRARNILTQALAIDSTNDVINSKLFYRRALTHSKLGNLLGCSVDLIEALKRNSKNEEMLTLLRNNFKVFLEQGDMALANQVVYKIQDIVECNVFMDHELQLLKQLQEHQDSAAAYYEISNWEACLTQVDKALEIATACNRWKLLKAECLAMQKHFDEAEVIVTELKHVFGLDYVKGLIHYYNGQLEEAIKCFQRELSMEKHHKKAVPLLQKSESILSHKETGDRLYLNSKKNDAIESYTMALAVDARNNVINSRLYCRRAIIYRRLFLMTSAINDCIEALKLNSNNSEAEALICSIVKGERQKGEIFTANQIICRILLVITDSKCLEQEIQQLKTLRQHQEQITKFEQMGCWQNCLFHVNCALEIADYCSSFKLQKVEYLTMLGRSVEAKEIHRFYSHSLTFVSGLIHYFDGDLKNAMKIFKQVLAKERDHKKAEKLLHKAEMLNLQMEIGYLQFDQGKFIEALKTFDEALTIDITNGKITSELYYLRSKVFFKKNEHRLAIYDLNRALERNNKYPDALRMRANCYSHLMKYEESVEDYERLLEIENTTINQKALKDAEQQLEKSKQSLTYYEILRVDQNTSTDEIKQAYHRLALVYHPDKHPNVSIYKKKRMEARFKEILTAYNTLSDFFQRRCYDKRQR